MSKETNKYQKKQKNIKIYHNISNETNKYLFYIKKKKNRNRNRNRKKLQIVGLLVDNALAI